MHLLKEFNKTLINVYTLTHARTSYILTLDFILFLGYNYAMISVKIALIKILSEFKFTTNLKMNELVLKLVGTLKLQNKHLVKVHRRRKLPRAENYAG